MTYPLALAAALLLAVTLPAAAGYPPIKYQATRAEIAEKCRTLGANGLGHGLDRLTGDYSCENLATGNTVECRGDGQCTSYSGDPRVKLLTQPRSSAAEI